MSYPAISPCAMVPMLHAARKRRTQVTSSHPHLHDCSHAGAHSELAEPTSGRQGSRSTSNMMELQPVNSSDPSARTLSDVTPSTESYRHQKQGSCGGVRNYEHLVQSSPPAASSDDYIIIDHNGNNENLQLYNADNLFSRERLGEEYRCSRCRRQREISHLCMSTSLPWNVTDGNDQGDLIPTFFSSTDTRLGEMAEADQDICVSSRHRILSEDELFVQELYTPGENISTSHNQNLYNRNEETDELHSATDTDSSETWAISSTATSSAELSPRKLSDDDIQPATAMPPGLVEVGRCSIYFDTKTGKYHSTVFGSFPTDSHSLLNTVKDDPGRHRLTSHPNEDLAFLSSESAGGYSLPNMSTHQFSSHGNRGRNRCGCATVEGGCVDGSAGTCSQCKHDFHIYVSDHATASSRQLPIPGHQNMSNGNDHITSYSCQLPIPGPLDLGNDWDSQQLVHTYPGEVTNKPEAKVKAHADAPSCVCGDMKRLKAPTGCADKQVTGVQRCRVQLPSHFVSEDDPTIIQANNSPTYFPLSSSPARTDDDFNEIGTDGKPHASPSSHTIEPYPQGRDYKGQNPSKLSTKQTKTTFSLSSFLGNMFSGKTRDNVQTNEDGCERKVQESSNVGQFETQRRPTSTADNDGYFCGIDLSVQAAACDKHSPHGSNVHDCEDSNSLSVTNEQTVTHTMGNSGDTDIDDENSEEKKKTLATFRERTRSYVAYLCCPPDALVTFGLPFHHLLESWGLPIFIPERNLPLSGPKYQNMAECVEESCNGKVIVILSNTYVNSEECLFVTFFAKTLDPDSRHRNIIPVLIDSDVQLPNVLRGLSLIKYNHLVRSGWLKEKLVRAIAA